MRGRLVMAMSEATSQGAAEDGAESFGIDSIMLVGAQNGGYEVYEVIMLDGTKRIVRRKARGAAASLVHINRTKTFSGEHFDKPKVMVQLKSGQS